MPAAPVDTAAGPRGAGSITSTQRWHRASQPSGRCCARMLSPSPCLRLGQEVPVLVLSAPPRPLCSPPEPSQPPCCLRRLEQGGGVRPHSPQPPLPGHRVPSGPTHPCPAPWCPHPALRAAGSGSGWPGDGGFGAGTGWLCVSGQESGACFTTGLRQSPQAMAGERQGVCSAPCAAPGTARAPPPRERALHPGPGRKQNPHPPRDGQRPVATRRGDLGGPDPSAAPQHKQETGLPRPRHWARLLAPCLHPLPPSIPLPTGLLLLPAPPARPRAHHPNTRAGDTAPRPRCPYRCPGLQGGTEDLPQRGWTSPLPGVTGSLGTGTSGAASGDTPGCEGAVPLPLPVTAAWPQDGATGGISCAGRDRPGRTPASRAAPASAPRWPAPGGPEGAGR